MNNETEKDKYMNGWNLHGATSEILAFLITDTDEFKKRALEVLLDRAAEEAVANGKRKQIDYFLSA